MLHLFPYLSQQERDGQMGEGPFTRNQVVMFARTSCRKYAFCRLTPWRFSAWLVFAISTVFGLLGLVVLVRGKWSHPNDADADADAGDTMRTGDIELATTRAEGGGGGGEADTDALVAGADRSETPSPGPGATPGGGRADRAHSMTVEDFAKAAGMEQGGGDGGGVVAVQ